MEKFVDFQIPEDMQSELGELTPNIKRKILGVNAARLYDIPLPDGMDVADEGTTPEITDEPPVPVGT